MRSMMNDMDSWYKGRRPIGEEQSVKEEGALQADSEELTEDEIEAQQLLDADNDDTDDAGEESAEESAEEPTGESAEEITGESTDESAGESGADSRVLQMYLDDLQSIEPISEKELAILIKKSHDGDLTARNRIVEGHLKYALSILWEYLNKGVELTELISETNMALIDVIDGYKDGDLKTEIARAVRSSASRLIDEDGQIQAADEDLARRVNELSDLSVEMVQELGRQPTNAELAHRLNISEDVVEALIRMSVDAL